MKKQKNDKEILIASFYELVAKLDKANNLFRKQPIYFQNLFKKYNLSKNINEKELLLQKIIYELTKLKPKFSSNSDYEITNLVVGVNDEEARVLISKYLNINVSLIDNIIIILKAIDTIDIEESDTQPPATSSASNEQNNKEQVKDIKYSKIPEDVVAPQETLAENVNHTLESDKKDYDTINSNDNKRNIQIEKIALEHSTIINAIVNLKIALKDPDCVNPRKNSQELENLLYFNLALNSDKNNEETDILKILKKNEPLKILEKYKEKYGEIISATEITRKVNKRLENRIIELFSIKSQTSKDSTELNSEDWNNTIAQLTSLMSIEEIVNLYHKIRTNKDSSFDKEPKKIQSLFTHAIKSNNEYEFVIKIPETLGNLNAEQMIICMQYLKEFPIGMKSKTDVQKAISECEISHPFLEEIMIALVKNISNDLN